MTKSEANEAARDLIGRLQPYADRLRLHAEGDVKVSHYFYIDLNQSANTIEDCEKILKALLEEP